MNNEISDKSVTNILLILGAGASKSMESKDRSASTIGINSGHKEMPLGDQLVQKISEYDKKSLAWLLASTLYQIRSTNYFSRNHNSIKPDEDFLEFGRLVERKFPENFSRHGYYSSEEEQKIPEFFTKKFSELFDPKALEESGRQDGIMRMNIRFGMGGIGVSIDDKERRSLTKIFHGSQFLVKKHEQKLERYNISFFAKLIFFELLILLLRNPKVVRSDFFYESLYRFVEASCREILSINNIPSIIRGVRLSGSQLSPYSIYSEYSAGFDQKIQGLKNVFNESLSTLDDSLNEVIEEANLLLTKYNSLSQGKSLDKGKIDPILAIVDQESRDKYADSPDKLSQIVRDTIFVGNNFPNFRSVENVFGIKIERRGRENVLSEVPISLHLESLILALKEVINSKGDVAKINNIIAILQKRGLLLDATYPQQNDFFSCIQRLIKAVRKLMFLEGGLSLPSLDNIDHLRQVFLSSKVVGHYNPQSIDYFMLNLDFFAPYELWDKNGEKYREMDESGKVTRKKVIQQYTKFIISNILIDAATANYYQAYSHGNDYINKMIWIINRTANFYNECPNSFIREHVKIITFNYESMFERQLFNRISMDNSNSLLRNVTAVYGKICLKDNSGKFITDAVEDSLWQSIFLSQGDEYFIKSPDGLETKYSIYKDIFEQLSSSMKWIGEFNSESEKQEREAERKKMIDQFSEANEVYFLGFGFDLNNLYQIGLIDKNGNVQIKSDLRKRFYVAGGNAKILNTIKTVFDCKEQQVITTSKMSYIDDPNFKKDDSEEVVKKIPKIPMQLTNHLYRLSSENNKIEFVVSDKMLPEALDDFGT